MTDKIYFWDYSISFSLFLTNSYKNKYSHFFFLLFLSQNNNINKLKDVKMYRKEKETYFSFLCFCFCFYLGILICAACDIFKSICREKSFQEAK